MTRLYLDLDGVLADFDTYFEEIFGVHPRKTTDAFVWSSINSHKNFFSELPLFEGGKEFFDRVNFIGLELAILTAAPKSNYHEAAKQKRQWVYKHICPHVTVLPVYGGKSKPLFMHSPNDILIDDFAVNCNNWRKAGGRAILHTDFKSSLGKLWVNLYEKKECVNV